MQNIRTNGRATIGVAANLPATGRFDGDLYHQTDIVQSQQWLNNDWRLIAMPLPPRHVLVNTSIDADGISTFNTLDAALDYIGGDDNWVILVQGMVQLTNSYSLNANISIQGIGFYYLRDYISTSVSPVGFNLAAIRFTTNTTQLAINGGVIQNLILTNHLPFSTSHTVAPIGAGFDRFENVNFSFTLGAGVPTISTGTFAALNQCGGRFIFNTGGIRLTNSWLEFAGTFDGAGSPFILNNYLIPVFPNPVITFNYVVPSTLGLIQGNQIGRGITAFGYNLIQNTGVALTNMRITYNTIQTGIDGTIGLIAGATNVIY